MDIILDKKKKSSQHTIIGKPNLLNSSKQHSKGGGIIPCIEGNVLVGPTAHEVYDREDYGTDSEDEHVLLEQMSMNKKLSRGDIIAYYSGIRAATWEEDFIVEMSEKVPNLIHAAGIQSPGFASAPAIAEDIAALALRRFPVGLKEKPNFISRRAAPHETVSMHDAERHTLIKQDPLYGKIVCRCEQISEGEIRDAVRSCRALGMQNISLDAVKRRCRAGMGRCHGSFCTPRVMEIISREAGIPLERITKKGGSSYILNNPLPSGEEKAAL